MEYLSRRRKVNLLVHSVSCTVQDDTAFCFSSVFVCTLVLKLIYQGAAIIHYIHELAVDKIH